MPSVYVEQGAHEYERMFLANGFTMANSVANADLLQLVGGADVSPSLYGEVAHPTTHSSALNDASTERMYQEALFHGIPIAGICRGSQFLSIMGGGKVWQHVDGHATGMGHSLLDIASGDIIEGCSSTHHQQHSPSSKAIILAVAQEQLSTFKCFMAGKQEHVFAPQDEDSDGRFNLVNDVEAFYYPHINALGYQPHPEFFDKEHPCQAYYFKLIEDNLNLTGE